MVDGKFGIICQLQFFFQSRQRHFPKVIMDALMHSKSRVINRNHILFFIFKMRKRMILKIFHCFLANPLAFLFLLPKIKQLIQNTEQFSMFLVNNIYANVIPVIPYQLISHRFSPLYFLYLKLLCIQVFFHCVLEAENCEKRYSIIANSRRFSLPILRIKRLFFRRSKLISYPLFTFL